MYAKSYHFTQTLTPTPTRLWNYALTGSHKKSRTEPSQLQASVFNPFPPPVLKNTRLKNDPAAGSFLVPSSLELSYLSVNVGVEVRDSPIVSHDTTKEAALNVSESRPCKNHQCHFEKQGLAASEGSLKLGTRSAVAVETVLQHTHTERKHSN